MRELLSTRENVLADLQELREAELLQQAALEEAQEAQERKLGAEVAEALASKPEIAQMGRFTFTLVHWPGSRPPVDHGPIEARNNLSVGNPTDAVMCRT